DNFPIWSPDSKQIIWTSSRTGDYELANGWGGGGGGPRWRADGKELFYMMGDAMVAVEISAEGQFRSGVVRRLFAVPGMKGNFPDEAPWLAKYDVTADGQNFVFVR